MRQDPRPVMRATAMDASGPVPATNARARPRASRAGAGGSRTHAARVLGHSGVGRRNLGARLGASDGMEERLRRRRTGPDGDTHGWAGGGGPGAGRHQARSRSDGPAVERPEPEHRLGESRGLGMAGLQQPAGPRHSPAPTGEGSGSSDGKTTSRIGRAYDQDVPLLQELSPKRRHCTGSTSEGCIIAPGHTLPL